MPLLVKVVYMDIKTIFDILVALLIFFWPGFILASLMAFDAPGSVNSGKMILISMSMITYPVIIFIIYTVLKIPFFSFPAIAPLIISILISLSIMTVFGHFKLVSNFSKGIKSSGYTITDTKVFYNGNLINGAEPKSFQELSESRYAPYSKDANNVYYKGKAIERASVASFKQLKASNSNDPDAFDGTKYYKYGKEHKSSE